jgi:hypothetical protein
MHTCQVTRFRRVTPGNRAFHPHFPEHPSGHGFHYDDSESPGIGPDIRNIYLLYALNDTELVSYHIMSSVCIN